MDNMKSLMTEWRKFTEEVEKPNTLLESSVNRVLKNAALKRIYLKEYKQTLLPGQEVTEEGFRDFIKKAKSKVLGSSGIDWEAEESKLDGEQGDKEEPKKKGIVQKTKDVVKGISDIGFLGRGSTLLGGEETFDIEKRNQLRSAALSELNQDLSGLGQALNKSKIQTDVNLTNIFKELDKSGFPNNKDFESQIKSIDNVHDKIVAEWKEKKYDSKTANAIISVLRHMVIYFQDFKLADKYFYIKEQEVGSISGEDRFNVKGKSMDDSSKNYAAAYANKLPAGLALAGVSMAGLGFAANSEMFKSVLDSLKDVDTVDVKTAATQIAKELSSPLTVGKGQGITQALQTMTDVDLSPSAPISNFLNPKVQPYVAAVKKAVVAKNGDEAGVLWDQLLKRASGPEGSSTMAKILQGPMKGTGASPVDLFDIEPGVYQAEILKPITTVVSKVSKVPANTLKNQFLRTLGKMAGPILQGLGIAALGGAAASKLMRMKGQHSSRMATLEDLYSTLVDVGAEVGATAGSEAGEQQAVSTETVAAAVVDLPTPENNEQALQLRQSSEAALEQAGVSPEVIEGEIVDNEELQSAEEEGDMQKFLMLLASLMKKNQLSIDSAKQIVGLLNPATIAKLQASPEVKQLDAANTVNLLPAPAEGELYTTPGSDRLVKVAGGQGAYQIPLALNTNQNLELDDEEVKRVADALVPYGVLYGGSYQPGRLSEQEETAAEKPPGITGKQIWQQVYRTNDWEKISQEAEFLRFSEKISEKSKVELSKVSKLLTVLLRVGLLGKPTNLGESNQVMQESLNRWKKLSGIIK